MEDIVARGDALVFHKGADIRVGSSGINMNFPTKVLLAAIGVAGQVGVEFSRRSAAVNGFSLSRDSDQIGVESERDGLTAGSSDGDGLAVWRSTAENSNRIDQEPEVAVNLIGESGRGSSDEGLD